MHYLYELSFPNGKSYVGIAVNPRRRLGDHIRNARNGHQYPIHHAVRKHGSDSLVMRVLACGDADYIADLEIRAIAAFGSRFPHGYNVALGGNISPTAAPEVREKIRQSKLRHWADPDYREHMRRAITGMVMTPEQNAKNGEAKRRNWADLDYRARTTVAHVGKAQSEETRAKRGAAISAIWDRGREARTVAMIGRIWINNGTEHRQLLPLEFMPEGWTRGMLKKSASQLSSRRRTKTYPTREMDCLT